VFDAPLTQENKLNPNIGRDQLQKGFAALDLEFSKPEIDAIHSYVHARGSHLTAFREALTNGRKDDSDKSAQATFQLIAQQLAGRSLLELFKQADTNKSGTLEEAEFNAMLRQSNIQLSEAQLRRLWVYAAKNDADCILYDRFASLFTQHTRAP